jgi:prevent-host-death family protein
MKRRVSAVDARQKLGELLESVYYRGDEVVIDRAGKTMAVVIPASLYESLERNRERLFELIEQNWQANRNVSSGQIERDVDAAIRDGRGKKRNTRRSRAR